MLHSSMAFLLTSCYWVINDMCLRACAYIFRLTCHATPLVYQSLDMMHSLLPKHCTSHSSQHVGSLSASSCLGQLSKPLENRWVRCWVGYVHQTCKLVHGSQCTCAAHTSCMHAVIKAVRERQHRVISVIRVDLGIMVPPLVVYLHPWTDNMQR